MSEAPAALAAKAEALIAEGELDAGLPLLYAALDGEPGLGHALECLGMVAFDAPEVGLDPLFARLAASVSRAPDQPGVGRALWRTACYGAFWDRIALVRSVANTPGPVEALGPDYAVSMLVLRASLGEDVRLADALGEVVGATASPLAVYHLARLDAAAGRLEGARARLESLKPRGLPGVLRECGLVAVELENPAAPAPASPTASTSSDRALLVGAGRSAAARAEQSEDALGPHLASEVLWLKLLVALAENKRTDAAWVGEQLGMPPADHDPAVMLRAAAHLGPLHLLRG